MGLNEETSLCQWVGYTPNQFKNNPGLSKICLFAGRYLSLTSTDGLSYPYKVCAGDQECVLTESDSQHLIVTLFKNRKPAVCKLSADHDTYIFVKYPAREVGEATTVSVSGTISSLGSLSFDMDNLPIPCLIEPGISLVTFKSPSSIRTITYRCIVHDSHDLRGIKGWHDPKNQTLMDVKKKGYLKEMILNRQGINIFATEWLYPGTKQIGLLKENGSLALKITDTIVQQHIKRMDEKLKKQHERKTSHQRALDFTSSKMEPEANEPPSIYDFTDKRTSQEQALDFTPTKPKKPQHGIDYMEIKENQQRQQQNPVHASGSVGFSPSIDTTPVSGPGMPGIQEASERASTHSAMTNDTITALPFNQNRENVQVAGQQDRRTSQQRALDFTLSQLTSADANEPPSVYDFNDKRTSAERALDFSPNTPQKVQDYPRATRTPTSTPLNDLGDEADFTGAKLDKFFSALRSVEKSQSEESNDLENYYSAMSQILPSARQSQNEPPGRTESELQDFYSATSQIKSPGVSSPRVSFQKQNLPKNRARQGSLPEDHSVSLQKSPRPSIQPKYSLQQTPGIMDPRLADYYSALSQMEESPGSSNAQVEQNYSAVTQYYSAMSQFPTSPTPSGQQMRGRKDSTVDEVVEQSQSFLGNLIGSIGRRLSKGKPENDSSIKDDGSIAEFSRTNITPSMVRGGTTVRNDGSIPEFSRANMTPSMVRGGHSIIDDSNLPDIQDDELLQNMVLCAAFTFIVMSLSLYEPPTPSP